MPAHMLPKNTETLKNMNNTTAKYARWYVRVLDPKVIDYSFLCKGERIPAKKFQCILVSKAPDQYMLGLVPFDFKDRNAATKAAAKFVADSVWELKTPAFDGKAKAEFNGCPIKAVVLLSTPTTTIMVPPTNQELMAYPSQGVHVALDIKGVIDILKKKRLFQALPAQIEKLSTSRASFSASAPQGRRQRVVLPTTLPKPSSRTLAEARLW